MYYDGEHYQLNQYHYVANQTNSPPEDGIMPISARQHDPSVETVV
jgi:hypothetical protein